MTTRNFSKSFKGKINGQRLPPIPITNEQTKTKTTNIDVPNSILKPSKPLSEDEQLPDHTTTSDDDDGETSRVIFRKTPADVLLLLDTYPPKNWIVPQCLQTNYANTLNQGRALSPIFDTIFSSENQHNDLIDAFPPPLSDRLPSSRYCRRSVGSSCSRRSSILYQRHAGVSIDSTRIQRENTFDTTVCESIPETIRPAYTPLPPIQSDASLHLSASIATSTDKPFLELEKSSLVIPTNEPSTELKSSLTIPITNSTSGISPPLLTSEEALIVQKKKEEFTQRLLSKKIHSDSTVPTTHKSMHSSTVAQKQVPLKNAVTPRIPKHTTENQRVSSVDRSGASFADRNKISTANTLITPNSSIAINTCHQRHPKMSLENFQPQSKFVTPSTATTINKKFTTTNTKSKSLPKQNTPKVKFTSTIPDDENIHLQDDVISHSAATVSLPATSIEASQVSKTESAETMPNPNVDTEISVPNHEQSTSNTSNIEQKRYSMSRHSAHYLQRCSHPVPKPLTLQGEKSVGSDSTQVNAKSTHSGCNLRQRRGSFKDQPLITDLFPDSTVELQNPIVKQECFAPTKSSNIKIKNHRPISIKSAKGKRPATKTKTKISATSASKITKKSQIKVIKENDSEKVDSEIIPEEKADTDMKTEGKSSENKIVVGGTNWMINVMPQIKDSETLSLLQSLSVPIVDDEDLPSCTSPTDNLAVSQPTLITAIETVTRRNSTESIQAVEISPVLTQTIEPNAKLTVQPASIGSRVLEISSQPSDIRTVYETVQDSIRKDASFRSLPSVHSLKDGTLTKPLPPTTTTTTTTTSLSSQNTSQPIDSSINHSHTYYSTDSGQSIRPPLRVVNDSLNSAGSETINSTSSHEDYSLTSLCSENDCDEIYRTAQKGQKVGKGAYGTVWSYLTKTGRVIAVKEIELDECDNDRLRDDYVSVRDEIHILRALNHPHIVKFLGISLESPCMVKIFMEYIPNGTIENLLLSFGPFHNDTLKKYTRQIVEGVSYLHENGVVHRDIKGKNIMVDADSNIKLIDFGCAKRLKQNQNTHSMRNLLKSMKGTANWMAPEVIAETGHGKKADIWSIGCTLCEMATGKPPWSSEHNQLAVLLIIVNGTKPVPDLPNTCPASAQEFFRLCLTREPSARPSAKKLLEHVFLSS